MNPAEIKYIDTDTGLAEACSALQHHAMLVVDTEFVRETTYYPIPALIQIYADETIFLIDPVTIKNIDPLKRILLDTGIQKVMHSCSEDLEVFLCLFGQMPTPVFDTQIAAAFCGFAFSSSYQKLVAQIVGHDIDKSETRSNWLQRPLTEKQCRYAAEDVLWLPEIHRYLHKKLSASDRLGWCMQECDLLAQQSSVALQDSDSYLRIKAAWRLDRPGLAVLRELAAWREAQCKQKNVPRARVASDHTLMDIALSTPKDKRDLQQLEGLSASSIRRYGSDILDCVAAGLALPDDKLPAALPEKNRREYRAQLRKLQAIVEQASRQMDIPKEILGRKRDLEDYLENRSTALIHCSWRRGIIGEQLDAALATTSK